MLYSYIYYHYDKYNNLLYVGCTTDPKRRIIAHKNKPWFKFISFTKYKKFRFSFDMKYVEEKVIKKQKPFFNINYNLSNLEQFLSSKDISINKINRDKCSLEKLLFNIYSSDIWNEAGRYN